MLALFDTNVTIRRCIGAVARIIQDMFPGPFLGVIGNTVCRPSLDASYRTITCIWTYDSVFVVNYYVGEGALSAL